MVRRVKPEALFPQNLRGDGCVQRNAGSDGVDKVQFSLDFL